MPKMFRKRLNDFEKISSENRQKSLLKNDEDFIRAPSHPRFGGITSYGAHKKIGKTGQEKIYYLAPHQLAEYFGLEILNRVGFNTEKVRVLPHGACSIMAVKQISGYMPIASFIHERSYNSIELKDPLLLANLRQYRLDSVKQVVENLETGEEYKISGNLFTSDIGARLLGDKDLQPEESNIGLVKRGNRFYAYMIDKEAISPRHHYDDIDDRALKSQIYKRNTREQQLFILNTVRKSLQQHDFKKICINERVLLTEPLVDYARAWHRYFDATAEMVIKKLATPEECDAFEQREAIREQLARSIIERLPYFLDEIDKDSLKKIIMEDLRAPYYFDKFINPGEISELDLSNEELITALVEDQTKELIPLDLPKIPTQQPIVDDLNVAFNVFKETFKAAFKGHSNSTGIKKMIALIEQPKQLDATELLEQMQKIAILLCNRKLSQIGLLRFFRREGEWGTGRSKIVQYLYDYLSKTNELPKKQFENMSDLIFKYTASSRKTNDEQISQGPYC